MTNPNAITALCSFVCSNNVQPLEPAEWSKLAGELMALKLEPKDLCELSDSDFQSKLHYSSSETERIKKLFDRSGALFIELSKYENMGVHVVTRADKEYPRTLKQKLARVCPPLFYYAGDLDIADDGFIGFVGSRTADELDLTLAKKLASNVVSKGFSIVSGGAKGIDSAAVSEAINCGGAAMEFLADSMLKRIKEPAINKALRDGRLLALSAVKPDAGFNTGFAMARNKYIYAASKATVVIKTEYNKGGTWAGAVENLKHFWTPTLCADNKSEGGKQLIKKGAFAITDSWDGTDIPKIRREENMTFSDLLGE